MNDSKQEFDPIDEDLIAYLDGELDAQACAEIEARIEQDGELQRRVEAYRLSWNMMDDLERVVARSDFAHSTVEMIALDAVNSDRKKTEAQVRFRRLLPFALIAASVCCASLSYALVRRSLTRSDRHLVRDFTVIENFDLYRHVQSVEFLELLAESELFAEGDLDEL